MRFNKQLTVDERMVFRALGMPLPADDGARRLFDEAAADIAAAALPRWVWRRLDLIPALTAENGALPLQGNDIWRHLEGCKACVLLAVTLGDGVERAIRTAGALDMPGAMMRDVVASTLTEQYANEAERLLAEQTVPGEYSTGRYSPGYGDLPLSLQKYLLHLLDAPKAIGLTVNEQNILLPRKSITAIIGVADHPVTGHLASCQSCKVREKCMYYQKGEHCGKTDF